MDNETRTSYRRMCLFMAIVSLFFICKWVDDGELVFRTNRILNESQRPIEFWSHILFLMVMGIYFLLHGLGIIPHPLERPIEFPPENKNVAPVSRKELVEQLDRINFWTIVAVLSTLAVMVFAWATLPQQYWNTSFGSIFFIAAMAAIYLLPYRFLLCPNCGSSLFRYTARTWAYPNFSTSEKARDDRKLKLSTKLTQCPHCGVRIQ